MPGWGDCRWSPFPRQTLLAAALGRPVAVGKKPTEMKILFFLNPRTLPKAGHKPGLVPSLSPWPYFVEELWRLPSSDREPAVPDAAMKQHIINKTTLAIFFSVGM